ncbi:glycosyltransferase [Bacillus sp. UMB0893]|uniref:glycosyltransferase n=1 Tax=Bacillus sp. UMB0893 TaxID=2066053 RepID=UPI000C783EBF|nr:glycosyltransferase [Bacillus sp. UMB0893]PLR68742.1 glycosyl transferase family 2 [Bacillus sp. UMB0893]
MKPKISIIVPIYNVEKYLSRCLDSLLLQSFKDFEIIAINDGSTDSSGCILDEYAKRHNEIIAIHKKNNGVSSARNDGLQKATGTYIGFVDPDDWIDENMYQVLYQTAEKEQADIVMCSYIREFGTHSKEKIFEVADNRKYVNEELKTNILRRLIGPIEKEVSNPEYLDAWGTVWSKLYKSELIKENKLEFVDLNEIGSNEDTLFNIQVFYHATSFVFLNQPLYHYWRMNETSVTSKYNQKLVHQFGTLYTKMEIFLQEKELKGVFQTALTNRISINTLGLGLNTISIGNKSSIIKKIIELNHILKSKHIKRSLNQFDMQHCPIVWKTFFFFAKKRIALGLFMMLTSIEFLRKTVR